MCKSPGLVEVHHFALHLAKPSHSTRTLRLVVSLSNDGSLHLSSTINVFDFCYMFIAFLHACLQR